MSITMPPSQGFAPGPGRRPRRPCASRPPLYVASSDNNGAGAVTPLPAGTGAVGLPIETGAGDSIVTATNTAGQTILVADAVDKGMVLAP
jgi:hypothetical protein